MLRPIAAGLMCLGFITLGVVATRGQEPEGKKFNVELIVNDDAEKSDLKKEPEAPGDILVPARVADPKIVEIEIGNDGKAAIVKDGEKKSVEIGLEGGRLIILNEDGKVVEKSQVEARPRLQGLRAKVAAPAIDPGTREALNKLIAGLKDEAKQLAAEGKKEESDAKLKSVYALQQLLNAPPGWMALAVEPADGDVRNRFIRVREPLGNDEFKKYREQMEDLRAQAAKIPESDKEGRAKLELAMAELKKRLSERQQGLKVELPVAAPLAPGAAPGAFQPGQPVPFTPGGVAGPGALAFIMKGASPEADALTRKSQALAKAAAGLRQAGLGDQARELDQQSAKLHSEADRIRAQAQHSPATVQFTAGAPHELHRSIHELQEQIQQLRKEVAELRELLQRRQ